MAEQVQAPAGAAAAGAVPAAAAAAEPETDYSSVMEAEPATTVAGGAAAETTSGDAAADTLAGDAKEPPVKPQPGTPDKALQKMQQDLAATQRLMAEVLAKQESGKPLSAAETAKLEAGAKKLDKIRDSIAARDLDLFESGYDIAESLVETDDRVAALEQTVAQQAQVIDQFGEQFTWQQLQAKYPGVEVSTVWEQAKKDSQSYARFGEDAWQTRADELFHSRADAAAKSVKAKAATGNKAPPPKVPSVPGVGAPTPITPGGASVTVQPSQPVTGKAAVSREEQDMADYMKLVE